MEWDIRWGECEAVLSNTKFQPGATRSCVLTGFKKYEKFMTTCKSGWPATRPSPCDALSELFPQVLPSIVRDLCD